MEGFAGFGRGWGRIGFKPYPWQRRPCTGSYLYRFKCERVVCGPPFLLTIPDRNHAAVKGRNAKIHLICAT
jgi:hypothetical protein